jgi:hypothetical membrane protein
MSTKSGAPPAIMLNTTTRLLVVAGVIGPLLLNILILIEGATRPGYDAWTMAGSALSLSNQGWEQIANFIVSGLLILGFAFGVRRALPGTTWGPILFAVVGIGLIVAGIFVTDPAFGYPPGTPDGPALHSTVHGALHFFVGGLAFFFGLTASCFVFARRFAGDPRWKGWAAASGAAGLLMLGFFIAYAIVAATMHDGPAGLLERISIATGTIWMAVFALRLLRSPFPALGPAGK